MSEYAEIAAHFESDFAEATLKEQRENGLFRHIEFAAPKSMNRLGLLTWPYNLLVAGSHGSYHFERYGQGTEDMFCWLRRLRVDADSWSSKLVSEFQHGVKYRSDCSCGKGADHDDYSSAVCWNALTHKGRGDAHKVKVHRTEGFDFDDFTEWHIHKLNYHFVYQCHAAVWGIAQYDAARKAVAA